MTETREEKLKRITLEAIVRGEDRPDIEVSLRKLCDQQDAQLILDGAQAEFEEMKRTDRLHDFEMALLAKKPKLSRSGYYGLFLIAFACAATALSYAAALPGATYSIFVGAFVFGLYRVAKG